MNKKPMSFGALKRVLSSPTKFVFEASTNREHEGWAGKGGGDVTCHWLDAHILVYEEVGTFETLQQKTFKVSNTYRWRFDETSQTIGLEHLRFGAENPVFLFNLVEVAPYMWQSSCPHLCDLDEYHGSLILEVEGFKLNWLVSKGSDYNRMDYIYSC